MELYYKDLISEDASLEKLVDDLMLLVQGANDFAQEAGLGLAAMPQEELAGKLERLKASCRRLKEQAVAGAVAADKTMRRYPYSSLGIAFGLGVLAGLLVRRR
jgi:ElaB/YqjD/DUF883 family membrane-anchored ribosome-binding protein